MNAKEYTNLVIHALKAHRNAGLAASMKAYQRDQFEFLGIQAPTRRLICQQLPKLPLEPLLLLDIAQCLWRQTEREYQYVACDVLKKNFKAFKRAHLPEFKKLLQSKSWWDTVDGLSSAISDLVLRETQLNPSCQTVMDTWLLDPDFWVRRSAMIHQLGWRQHTDTQRLGHYALHLAPEKEFFIRKAIGWALRDHARHNPAWVGGFIQKNAQLFSGLTVREASKNL